MHSSYQLHAGCQNEDMMPNPGRPTHEPCPLRPRWPHKLPYRLHRQVFSSFVPFLAAQHSHPHYTLLASLQYLPWIWVCRPFVLSAALLYSVHVFSLQINRLVNVGCHV